MWRIRLLQLLIEYFGTFTEMIDEASGFNIPNVFGRFVAFLFDAVAQ